MQVNNSASFPVIAVCYFKHFGTGDKELIQPGASAQILGPPIGNIEGRTCYAILTEIITCHDNPADNYLRVVPGHPLCIGDARASLTVWHHLDGKNQVFQNPLYAPDQK